MSNKKESNEELEYLPLKKITKVSDNVQKSKSATGSYLPPPPESFYDEIVKRKSPLEKLKMMFNENPFVPIGCAVTAGVLINGIIAMKRGDRVKSQKMMRYRVAAQGATLVALVGGTVFLEFYRRTTERNSEKK